MGWSGGCRREWVRPCGAREGVAWWARREGPRGGAPAVGGRRRWGSGGDGAVTQNTTGHSIRRCGQCRTAREVHAAELFIVAPVARDNNRGGSTPQRSHATAATAGAAATAAAAAVAAVSSRPRRVAAGGATAVARRHVRSAGVGASRPHAAAPPPMPPQTPVRVGPRRGGGLRRVPDGAALGERLSRPERATTATRGERPPRHQGTESKTGGTARAGTPQRTCLRIAAGQEAPQKTPLRSAAGEVVRATRRPHRPALARSR